MKTASMRSAKLPGTGSLYPVHSFREQTRPETPLQFISTTEAARMLGLSTGNIQSLVDNDDLKGWKTRGGHRRIAIQSVMDYQMQAGFTVPHILQTPGIDRIMVVVESTELMTTLQSHCDQWNFPVEVTFIQSITEALLCFSEQMPDLLLAEFAMPRSEQEKTIQALVNFNARQKKSARLVLLTSEENLRLSTADAIDSQFQVVKEPLNPVWLHAFLTGVSMAYRSQISPR